MQTSFSWLFLSDRQFQPPFHLVSFDMVTSFFLNTSIGLADPSLNVFLLQSPTVFVRIFMREIFRPGVSVIDTPELGFPFPTILFSSSWPAISGGRLGYPSLVTPQT